MTVHTEIGDGTNIVLREDYMGRATRAICYPGISSCISITCVSPTGLVGAHITVGTTAAEIAQMFQYFRANMAGIYAYYVVGSIDLFKQHTGCTEIDTRTKLKERLKREFNPKGAIAFYNTSPNGEVHVFAEKNGMKTTFYWIVAADNNVAGMNYPAFAGRTVIDDTQLVTL